MTKILVPSLHPGYFVMWNSFGVYKSAVARQQIEAAGCQVVFLPLFSAYFARIAPAFGKLKQYLRRAGARTREKTLDGALTAAVATITVADARAWLRHCGYAL